MHILVTNDDGVDAPGLLALAQAVRPFGRVSIVAPERNWSACGHVKTLRRAIHVKSTMLADGTPALTTDAAPSDCVAMVVLGLLDAPVDLVVTGINPYANLGEDLTYSGTVTSAMEAAVWGLPAAAFSVDGVGSNAPLSAYALTQPAITAVIERIIQHGLPPKTCLNVNIPNLPAEKLRGFRVTRQGKRVYRDVLLRQTDENGQPCYVITGELPEGLPGEGTDTGELAEGYVSIMPLHLDLTAHHLLEQVRGWDWPVYPASQDHRV
jgi:5'-nucleotidase